MAEFNWTCPYCSHYQTVAEAKCDVQVHRISVGETCDGNAVGVELQSIGCSNPSCKNVTIRLLYGTVTWDASWRLKSILLNAPIKPESSARPLPSVIPDPIARDYLEACRIATLSPKASATLARRCLQGMIRDFCGIAKPTLHQEINELKKQFDVGNAPRGVSEESFDAIEAIRKLGNIGAHMEKDINVIVDVEPDEAELLLNLVENLFEEWYIARQKRQERLARVTASVEQKDAIRNATSE